MSESKPADDGGMVQGPIETVMAFADLLKDYNQAEDSRDKEIAAGLVHLRSPAAVKAVKDAAKLMESLHGEDGG